MNGKHLYWILVVGLIAMTAPAQDSAVSAPAAGAVAAMQADTYACPMGHFVSNTPGKCPTCGMEMKAVHVLSVKDGMAACCSCKSGCKCKAADETMAKCTCGKKITQVGVKGKYICPEGKCNAVSDKPGKCCCGADMKKVE